MFAPTVANPQVEATGEVISVPSISAARAARIPFPGGALRQFAAQVRRVPAEHDPCREPDFAARQAAKWGRDHDVPVLATVHTRFETYPRYYHARFLEPTIERWLEDLLPPRRRADGPGRNDARSAARTGHARRDRDLGARGGPQLFSPRRAQPRLAAQAGNRRRGGRGRLPWADRDGKGARRLRQHDRAARASAR